VAGHQSCDRHRAHRNHDSPPRHQHSTTPTGCTYDETGSPSGVAYGLYMIDEMVALKLGNARDASLTNALPQARARVSPARGQHCFGGHPGTLAQASTRGL